VEFATKLAKRWFSTSRLLAAGAMRLVRIGSLQRSSPWRRRVGAGKYQPVLGGLLIVLALFLFVEPACWPWRADTFLTKPSM
jgi:hypothetical protein